MPPSMHTILLHCSIVIKHALVPIGLLSEEAQEAYNKNYKNFRENHTRKTSRLSTNTDLMHALLISSDPVISSKRTILKNFVVGLPCFPWPSSSPSVAGTSFCSVPAAPPF